MKAQQEFLKYLRYLREVSIVIVGVAATLYASGRISHWNDQKEIALNLSWIKEELEQNEEQFALNENYFRRRAAYSRYLRFHPKEELNVDSLLYYAYKEGIYGFHTLYYDSSAFESFKNSGLMPKMKNRQLMLSIWAIYNMMTVNLQDIREWERKKEEHVKKDMALIEFDGSDNGRIINHNGIIPLYTLHMFGDTPALVEWDAETRREINKVIAMIEAELTGKKIANPTGNASGDAVRVEE
ncbi:MAG: hypothetical protein LBR57_04375 [Alistipes sp.]|jgi:hypothetical protein|nr:hypothetical protein [Alistipes sp.]